jgi:hypothetical protein
MISAIPLRSHLAAVLVEPPKGYLLTANRRGEWAEHQTSRGIAVPTPRTVQEVMTDPDAEFNPAAGESLVMIPLKLEAVAGT